jgi:alpha-aminoadipate carrier protein LysW
MVEQKAECPDCGAEKEVAADAQQGEVMACACCGTLLEILALAPLKIGKAPQVEEDFGE